MKKSLRKTGIGVVGGVSWGAHFCQFYQSKDDLVDVLVPYFKAGLESNEFCMWVISQPLGVKGAEDALRDVLPDFDVYLKEGQIEIIPYTEWYLEDGVFDSKRVLNGWVEKLDNALERGYDGLRLTGNTFWLEKDDWGDFTSYEEEVDQVLGNYNIISLCTYCLDKCNATEIIDVVANHQFALIKREEKWEMIENSKHKKMEETIVKASKEWEQTFNAVPDLIAILGTDHNIISANQPMADSLGVESEDCVGLTCYNVVHGTDEPPSFCPHQQLLEDGVEHALEVHEDNLGGYFLVSASPLYDPEGKLVGSVHVACDINRRKQVEEALIRSENEFRTLAENSPDIITLFDRQMRHIYVNPAAAELYGLNSEEIIGKTFNELKVGLGGKFWKIHHEKVFNTGNPETAEFHYMSPQGEEYYFNTRAVPEFVDGEVASIIAISRDITDIKRTEAELTESHNNLEEKVKKRTVELKRQADLLDLTHDAIFVRNLDDEIVFWNKGAEEIYGWNQKEALGITPHKLLQTKFPNPLNEIKAGVMKHGRWEGELTHIKRDNKPIIVSSRWSLQKEDNGEPIGFMEINNDITEIKKAQDALDMANTYNRSLIEVSLDPLVTIGPDGKITDVNNSTEVVTGISRDELIGTDFSDYFTQPEKARKGYKRVFKEGFVRDYPLEILHRKGNITPVLYNASVYKDDNGEVIGVFAAARDITEAKRAEKNLKLAIRYNRSLIEASVDPLVTIGPDGKITDVNNSTEEVTGYSRDHLIGTDFSDYFTEPGKAKEGYKQVFQEGMVRDYPLEILHKNGHTTPVLYNASVYKDDDGEVIGVFAAAHDITDRKRAEEKLRLSYIYNRSLIEASVDPLVTIGPDGKITDVNKATEEVTGCLRSELIGTDFSDYFTEPDQARKGYQQVFQEGVVIDYPLEIEHKDGHTTQVLYNASIYKDESGEVIGVFAAARDVTERKRAEKLLKLKIDELARSNFELEQFAYVSSHDLQEPLRMIGSYLQLLERRYQGQLDDKAEKYIQFAVDGATRMQNLINDLLEFSRVTTRAKEFQLTDCESVYEDVLSNLKISITENDAIITHDPLPEVMADDTQLTQVFQNLISNAIKFRSQNNPKIHISAFKEDDQWLFSVKDNGIGIDPKHSIRIFEVFKRLHKRREYPGTGIGLSICKKIIERHGGHMWVESELGEGAVFYFTLPDVKI